MRACWLLIKLEKIKRYHYHKEKMMAERKRAFPIDDIFIDRWSPRALSGEPISDDELFTLFEAARWAPSSYNNQPWRFVYAKRDTPHWKRLFGFLVHANQEWAKHAAALIVVISFDLSSSSVRARS